MKKVMPLLLLLYLPSKGKNVRYEKALPIFYFKPGTHSKKKLLPKYTLRYLLGIPIGLFWKFSTNQSSQKWDTQKSVYTIVIRNPS